MEATRIATSMIIPKKSSSRSVVVVVVVSRWNLSWFFVGPSLASLGEAICPPERSRGAVVGLVDSMSV